MPRLGTPARQLHMSRARGRDARLDHPSRSALCARTASTSRPSITTGCASGCCCRPIPTVVYALGRRPRRVYEKNLMIRSPYNTYLHPGLPPGPICQPDSASLAAALYPAPAPFIYFVAQPDGKHIFSVTYAEHLAAIRRVKELRCRIDRRVERRPDHARRGPVPALSTAPMTATPIAPADQDRRGIRRRDPADPDHRHAGWRQPRETPRIPRDPAAVAGIRFRWRGEAGADAPVVGGPGAGLIGLRRRPDGGAENEPRRDVGAHGAEPARRPDRGGRPPPPRASATSTRSLTSTGTGQRGHERAHQLDQVARRPRPSRAPVPSWCRPGRPHGTRRPDRGRAATGGR